MFKLIEVVTDVLAVSLFPQRSPSVSPEMLQLARQLLGDRLRAPKAAEAAAGRDLEDPLDRCPIIDGRVHLPLREQLQACRDLRATAHGLLVDAAFVAPEDHEILQSLLDVRAYSFFEAVLVLAHRGYGEQALVLGRSLFETMLDQYWVAANSGIAVQRWREHFQFWAKDLDRKEAASAGRDVARVSNGDAREHKRLRTEYGKSFTGLSSGQKVVLLEAGELRYGVGRRHTAELTFDRSIYTCVSGARAVGPLLRSSVL